MQAILPLPRRISAFCGMELESSSSVIFILKFLGQGIFAL